MNNASGRGGSRSASSQPLTTLCVESYIGDANGSEGVELEQQVLICEDGQELLSTFPFEPALLDRPA